MTTEIAIEVEGRSTPFELDWERQRWRTWEEQKEGDFSLITVVDGKRYELYSDETFAEVEKSERAIIPEVDQPQDSRAGGKGTHE